MTQKNISMIINFFCLDRCTPGETFTTSLLFTLPKEGGSCTQGQVFSTRFLFALQIRNNNRNRVNSQVLSLKDKSYGKDREG